MAVGDVGEQGDGEGSGCEGEANDGEVLHVPAVRVVAVFQHSLSAFGVRLGDAEAYTGFGLRTSHEKEYAKDANPRD